MTTCEQIVKKDFALDPDETRMRNAAHHMVRNLTAGMAMITARNQLSMSISDHVKNFIVSLTRSQTNKEAVENTAKAIANDNVELACAFVQKKAIEKAIPEIDKKLAEEFELRMKAKAEGRRYCDQVAHTYQSERMPEAIRLKVGGITNQQFGVYKEFAHNIPGFKTLTDREMNTISSIASKPGTAADTGSSATQDATPGAQEIQQPRPAPSAGVVSSTASDECISILTEVVNKVEPFVQNCSLPAQPHMNNLHGLLEAMNTVRSTKETVTVDALIRKVVENLLEGLTVPPNQGPVDQENLARYRDANLLALKAISDNRAYGSSWTLSKVTRALVDVREDIKYNLDAFDALIRSQLINLYEYDKHLAAAMANGENTHATQFAMHLCKIYLIDDRTNAQVIESDLFGTIEVLEKIKTQHPNPPEGIASLMDMIKMSSERLEQNLAMAGPTAQLHSGIQQAREFEDPMGLLEKTEFLLREWVNAYHSRDAGKDSRQAFVIFVQLMNQHGILKTDDLITRFLPHEHPDVCRPLLQSPVRTEQQPHLGQSQVLPHSGCLCPTDHFTGEAFRRDSEYHH